MARASRPGRINALVVGAGLMGYWHALTASRIGVNVQAIVDPDTDRASSLARKVGCEFFTDIQSAVSAVTADVAHVCTPAKTHETCVSLLLNTGCHVLCEKPLAPSAMQADELIDLAQRSGLQLAPVHQFVFQRGTEQAMAKLADLGTIQTWQFRVSTAGADRSPTMLARDLLMDVVPHPLSVMQRMFPDVPPLKWSVAPQSRAETLLGIAEHENVQFTMDISTLRRPTECHLEISGTEASIVLDFFHGYCIFRPGRTSRYDKALRPISQGTRQVLTATGNLVRRFCSWEPAYPGLRALFRSFYASIRDGSPPPFSSVQIRALYETRDRIAEQLGTGD